MKENVLNLVKSTYIQVQEAQRVPNKMDPQITPRHIIIKMPKVKDKERILKVAREKERVTYKQKGAGKNIQSYERQGPTYKIILPRKAII